MEDAAAAEAAHKDSLKSPSKSLKSPTLSAKSGARSGVSGGEEEQEDRFTGLSCLLITWKTNPEVENFRDLYQDKMGDLVSEKSLSRNYRIIGKVRTKSFSKDHSIGLSNTSLAKRASGEILNYRWC